jgi:hypothetical protein
MGVIDVMSVPFSELIVHGMVFGVGQVCAITNVPGVRGGRKYLRSS